MEVLFILGLVQKTNQPKRELEDILKDDIIKGGIGLPVAQRI